MHVYRLINIRLVINNDLPPSCKFQNMVPINSEFSLLGLSKECMFIVKLRHHAKPSIVFHGL